MRVLARTDWSHLYGSEKLSFLRIVVGIAVLCNSAMSFAIDDTPENRAIQAERVIAATPPDEMMADMAENVSMNLPPSDRAEFRRLMTEFVDLEILTNVMRESMIRNFTADELAALSELYESPIGKSAIGKMGLYMADIMPTVEAEIMRAIGELQKAKAAENRQRPDPVE